MITSLGNGMPQLSAAIKMNTSTMPPLVIQGVMSSNAVTAAHSEGTGLGRASALR
jgi:hypothetical protein